MISTDKAVKEIEIYTERLSHFSNLVNTHLFSEMQNLHYVNSYTF